MAKNRKILKLSFHTSTYKMQNYIWATYRIKLEYEGEELGPTWPFPPLPLLSVSLSLTHTHTHTYSHTHTQLLSLLWDQIFLLLHLSFFLPSLCPSICLSLSFSLSISGLLLLSEAHNNHLFQISTMTSAFDIWILNQKWKIWLSQTSLGTGPQ